LAACLAVFGLLAAFTIWAAPDTGPPGKTPGNPPGETPSTVTLAPGVTGPAGLTVTDLHDVGQLQRRFNADQGHPRLLLALAPT
jgi:hypothetical protein